MEELIKKKRKAAQEVNNNRTKLESRCQELESRNYELEQTVKTLMKKIESLELTNIHENRSETNKGNSGAKTMQTYLVIMTAWQTTSTTGSCVCTRS
jgi:predicted nuclease with TOPRIM domain